MLRRQRSASPLLKNFTRIHANLGLFKTARSFVAYPARTAIPAARRPDCPLALNRWSGNHSWTMRPSRHRSPGGRQRPSPPFTHPEQRPHRPGRQLNGKPFCTSPVLRSTGHLSGQFAARPHSPDRVQGGTEAEQRVGG